MKTKRRTKINARQLALDAMLAAMCAVLGYVAVDALSIKITFESLPILLGGLLFGPLDGALIGLVGTGVYQLLRYGVSATTVLWMLPYIISGLVAGFYAKRRNFELDRKQALLIAIVCELLVTLLNTPVMYLDSKIYGYYFKGYISGMLLVRLGVALAKGIVFGLVLPPLLKAIRRVLSRKTSGSEKAADHPMTEKEAIQYIEAYTWSTTKLGLERTKALLQGLGDPQKKLKFIHVAGSNGKGSTCAMLDAILRAAGYRTGLYISPYIQDFCERMQVNGENIPGETLAALTERVKVIADAMEDHPSQFELVTAIAMEYFYEAKCDIVVLEVGMGGALDSTNAIDAPEVAVITNIGLEHTEYLGDTLEKIAATKAGIIKPGCSAVCYDGAPEVTEVIRGVCEKLGVPLRCNDFSRLTPLSETLDGQEITWDGRPYRLALLGRHQLHNTATVMETVDSLRERGWEIPDEAVRTGLASVKWPARLEVLGRDPLFLLDGGHNPQCAEALCASLDTLLGGKKAIFIIGVLADKDYPQIMSLVMPYAEKFFCLTPHSSRALTAEHLAEYLQEQGAQAVACHDIETAIRTARDAAGEDGAVVSFGSLYLAGGVRTAYQTLYGKQ